jgi:hypothetical protein
MAVASALRAAPAVCASLPVPDSVCQESLPRRGRRRLDPFADDDDSDDDPGGRETWGVLLPDPAPAVARRRLLDHPMPTFAATFPLLIYAFCTLLI